MTRQPPFAWLLLLFGVALVLAALMVAAVPAQAQCGSEASSCKTCHEIRGEHPVNTTGAWHVDHAFEDYCASCHRGDTHAPDPADAHAEMNTALADMERYCGVCHQDATADLLASYSAMLGNPADASVASAPAGSAVDPLDAPAASTDPLDAPADPLDAPAASADPLDAPASDPLDAPTSGGEIVNTAASSEPEVDAAAAARENGNRLLIVMAEGLLVLGFGTVWYFERRK